MHCSAEWIGTINIIMSQKIQEFGLREYQSNGQCISRDGKAAQPKTGIITGREFPENINFEVENIVSLKP